MMVVVKDAPRNSVEVSSSFSISLSFKDFNRSASFCSYLKKKIIIIKSEKMNKIIQIISVFD